MKHLYSLFSTAILLLIIAMSPNAIAANGTTHHLLKNIPCIKGMGTCGADVGSTITTGQATLNDLLWTDPSGRVTVGNTYQCKVTNIDLSKGYFLVKSGYYGTVPGGQITITGQQSFLVTPIYQDPKRPHVGFIGFIVNGTNAGSDDQADFTCQAVPVN